MRQKTECTVRDLAIDLIRSDGGTQSRVRVDTETVDSYAEAMVRGEIFPPIVVFYDLADYWLADGWHRLKAFRKTTRWQTDPSISADVRRGSKRDALLYSIGANGDHGLPRTNEDKRKAVTLLLQDPEWSEWSDGVVAQKANVSQAYVSKIRRETAASVDGQTSSLRRTVRGHVMNTINIGRLPKKAPRHIVTSDYQGPERRKSARREADRQLIAALTN